jgi:hypothetical protein
LDGVGDALAASAVVVVNDLAMPEPQAGDPVRRDDHLEPGSTGFYDAGHTRPFHVIAGGHHPSSRGCVRRRQYRMSPEAGLLDQGVAEIILSGGGSAVPTPKSNRRGCGYARKLIWSVRPG